MRKLITLGLLVAALSVTGLGAPATLPAEPFAPGAPAYEATHVLAHRDGAVHVTTAKTTTLFTRLFSADVGAGRWDPCKPVLWKMNAAGYNKKRFDQVVKAFRQIRKASGLTIRYGGLTNDEEISSPEQGVITVSFVKASTFPRDVVATAGVGVDYWENGGGITQAAIRVAVHKAYDSRSGYIPVLLHEIGHAVGLGHSDDKRSVMYAYQNGVARLNRSDLLGLKTVGAENGCVTPHTPDVPVMTETPNTVPADPAGPVPENQALSLKD